MRRNQFTDVTGPGGLYGNDDPADDPIWSIGWDHRSLILMLRSGGAWQHFRLPKASHCYDGAHGWNTEWPRIRDIGEDDLLMTMHGMFWRFPARFSSQVNGGIRPRSTYLKVIGDFCRWQDQIVFGCDDAAQSEFLNIAQGQGADRPAPLNRNPTCGSSRPRNSINVVLRSGGAPCGWTSRCRKSQPSDAFLFGGFAQRGVCIWSIVPTSR